MRSRRNAKPPALLAAAELFTLLLAIPALLFPAPGRLLLTLLVPVVWLWHWRVSERFIPATPLNAALLLLLGMVGVSLFATYDVGASRGKVCGVLLGAIVYWTSTRWITTAERLRIATMMFLIAGAGLATVGLLGTNWFAKFPVFGAVVTHLPRAIRGVPGAEEGFHPNAVAGCLVLFVPLQCALLMASAGGRLAAWRSAPLGWMWSPLVQVPGGALTAGTLLLTQSRGAWVGMIVAAMAGLAWHGRQTRLWAAVVAGATVAAGWASGGERLLNLAISQSGPGMAGNVSSRMELWSRALDGIADFPLTGMGMNTFRTVLPVLYPLFLTPPDFDVAHAHNHLLQAALDVGIPGLIAYLAIWLVAGALLVRVYRLSPEPAAPALAGGLGAGLIAHFCFSLTDAIPLGAKVGILFWLTLALVVALHQVSVPPDGATARTPPAARRS